eukprot:g4162.t1
MEDSGAVSPPEESGVLDTEAEATPDVVDDQEPQADDKDNDDMAAADNDDEDEEGAARRRRGRSVPEEEQEEEGVLKDPPYEYPTGVVEVDDQEMLPAGNLYERWTATPGIPGEPLENVTLTLKFEAMGAQDLTVGLAHKSGGKGKEGMYQLIIGNKGNLQVDLQKRQGRNVDTVASTAGLLCAAKKAHRYWVAVKNGRVDFGVGDVCGQRTVLSYQDADSPIEVRYLGFTCLKHRVTFRDIKMQAEVGGPLREAVETELEFIRAEGCDEGFSGEDKASLDAALEQYQRECENMKRRARKFGGVYSPPFLQDWVPWTIVKRLSWNRDNPMEARYGINDESQEEREKRKLRAERFGQAEAPAPPVLQTPLAARVDPDVAEMMTDEKRFARSQKFNISDQMWSIQAEEQGLTPGDIFCSDPDRADPEPMATTFPHKIHIFSLDKTVCKQIRDNDVKAYFEGFGPKYVEWLSDWSFNVVFDSPDEAKKAAASKSFALPEALSKEIEESIGEEGEAVASLGAMGWRLGVPMCKVSRDRYGPKGQWVRLLLRCAEAQDILLARPQVPAKPEGPLLRRPGGSKLPPAVRVAQGLSGTDSGGSQLQQNGGGGRKRHRGGGSGGGIGPEGIMGQALKAPRTSSGNRRRGGGGGGGGGGRGGERDDGDAAASTAAPAAEENGAAPPAEEVATGAAPAQPPTEGQHEVHVAAES